MADALVVVADDRRDLHGAQQPPRPDATMRSNAPIVNGKVLVKASPKQSLIDFG